MKRLDQLTQEDLYNYHDRMMGIDEDELFNGHLFHVDELGADEMLMAKEEYEQFDRSSDETKEDHKGRTGRSEAVDQPRDGQDQRVPAGFKARVWRQTRKNPSELGQDKPADG